MIVSPTNADITAVVLAGGQGRRVASQDKGLIEFSGKRLVEHVIESLSAETNNIVIVANRHIDTYASFGFPVVSDRIEGFQGPLAGIDAAFSVTASSFLLCAPCDSPFLPDNLLSRFINAASGNNPMVIAGDGERVHPVINLLHRSVWSDVEDRLAQGRLKLMDWINATGYDVADFSTCPDLLQNLNTLEQIKSSR